MTDHEAQSLTWRGRKRSLDETIDTTGVDNLSGSSGHTEINIKRLRCSTLPSPTSPEDLPAELLESIAWLSLSPILPLVSKRIFHKLGHMKCLRQDMALLIFCGWEEIRDEGFEKRDPEIDTSKLPMQTSVALSTPPPILDWCDAEFLDNLATKIMRVWWTRNHPDYLPSSRDYWDELCQFNRKVSGFRRFFIQLTDHDHSYGFRKAYMVKTVCWTKSNRHHPSQLLCPYNGTKDCPKNQGINALERSGLFPHRTIFALPRIPDRVLAQPHAHDVAKGAQMKFYRKSRRATRLKIEVSADWSCLVILRGSVKAAVLTAIKERRYDILRLLLREKSSPEASSSVYSVRNVTDDWEIAGQLIVLGMIHQQHWSIIMRIVKHFAVEGPWSKGLMQALRAAGQDFKVILLTYADEAFMEGVDGHAERYLEWWIHVTSISEHCSPLTQVDDLSPEIQLSSTNDRALSQANKKVYAKVDRIRKEAR